MTTFRLLPTPDSLAPSQPLHLLPFSLGPNNTPYASTSAPIRQYFRPRPCPKEYSTLTGIPQDTPIAAFRGRQIVGQEISVPTGYRGLVLSTGKRPDKGGVEVRSSRDDLESPQQQLEQQNDKPKWPLTPASSIASTVVFNEEDVGLRRSPRKSGKVRGSGQVALVKPKIRQVQVKTSSRKRFRLDSDDDDDDDEGDEDENQVKTPGKRRKITEPPVTPMKTSPLPEIVVVAPTPLKEIVPPGADTLPLPPDVNTSGALMVVMEDNAIERERGIISPPAVGEKQEEVNTLPVEEEEFVRNSPPADIIPSPATEDDPPSFEVFTLIQQTTGPEEHSSVPVDDDDDNNNIRNLIPTSTFNSFTLWTPDVPLPGFKPDELDVNGANLKADRIKTETQDPNSNGYLDDGWWRLGGGGEGGDEMVRGLGEWLGLVEELNRPVYLHDIEDESDDDE